MKAPRLMAVLGLIKVLPIHPESYGVVLGALILGFVGVRTATLANLLIVLSISVFGLCVLFDENYGFPSSSIKN